MLTPYKVKSEIRLGTVDHRNRYKPQVFRKGKTVMLEPSEAYELRHALENPPEKKPHEDPMVAEAQKTIDERPDNPDSGVDLHWKSSTFKSGKRPESNKTVSERAAESGIKRAQAEANGRARARQMSKPVVGSAAPVAPAPIVSPMVRPAPAVKTKK